MRRSRRSPTHLLRATGAILPRFHKLYLPKGNIVFWIIFVTCWRMILSSEHIIFPEVWPFGCTAIPRQSMSGPLARGTIGKLAGPPTLARLDKESYACWITWIGYPRGGETCHQRSPLLCSSMSEWGESGCSRLICSKTRLDTSNILTFT